MPEVRTAARLDFGSIHAMAAVGFFRYVLFGDWFGKAGPSRTAVEFLKRTKEWFARHYIDVNPGRVIVPVSVIEGRLRSTFLRDVILLRRQLFLQFFVRRFRRPTR